MPVDHASERAAQQIYKRQLLVLANHETAFKIRHMVDQELEHLGTFDSLLDEQKARPSLVDPLWCASGFALGVITAAMCPKATMNCDNA